MLQAIFTSAKKGMKKKGGEGVQHVGLYQETKTLPEPHGRMPLTYLDHPQLQGNWEMDTFHWHNAAPKGVPPGREREWTLGRQLVMLAVTIPGSLLTLSAVWLPLYQSA